MNKLEQLRAVLGRVSDLEKAAALLDWDQQTYMPAGGAAARAEQMATLQELAHSTFVDDRVGRLLEDLEPWADDHAYESDEASLVRVTSREYAKRKRLPARLVAERARTATLAHAAWESAREQASFSAFQPHLERVVDICIQVAEALGYQEHIYDALLDLFEPEMKTSAVASIFEELKGSLIPLVAAISERGQVPDDAVLKGGFDPAKQWELGIAVLQQIGFCFERGRQDKAVHPFTTSFSPDDVRLTTRINPSFFPAALFGTIHEGGHALYDQGLPASLARTPLCEGASMAVHESQSRMWENIVGRGWPFWQHFAPKARALFPAQFERISDRDLYRAVNRVEPGLIRVEADEVTYNLHIFMRFEIETDLLQSKLRVSDLPEVWNSKMQTYLGIIPPDDAVGVLQDVHWSGALLGYFPTYALGNLLSVQFYERAVSDIPEIPAQISRGEFQPLLAWMRDRIHSHGARFTPDELVARVTGGSISAKPFIRYIHKKYAEICGL